METIDVNDLPFTIDNDEHRVIFNSREIETGEVTLIGSRLLPLTFGTITNVAEHRARPLEEFGAVFLIKAALRDPRAFSFDERPIKIRIRPRRLIPALEVGIVIVGAATPHVVEPALAARRRYQQCPTTLVDEALRKITIPN